MTNAKTRHLTAYLMKDDIADPKDGLKHGAQVKAHKLKAGVPFDGVFFLQSPQQNPPGWADFVGQGVNGLALPNNVSSSGVLFVKKGMRYLAFTFGHGHHLLNPGRYVRDFGLRVALNRIDPESLRSVDAKTVEDLTIHTRRQASAASRFETFGLNVTQDLVRAVTGTSADDKFATAITGSDGLAFTSRLEFKDLGAKCAALLNAYGDTAYKKRFGFIDYVQRERDPSVVSALDDQLVKDLRAGALGRTHMAPAEIVDWKGIAGFAYPDEDASHPVHADLDPATFLASVPNAAALSLDQLRRERVLALDGNGGKTLHEWPVYDLIVHEVDRGANTYVLSGGDWYEIAHTFAMRTRKKVKDNVGACAIKFPRYDHADENDYNTSTSAAKGWACMDADEVDQTEVCDCFTPAGQFIHVKRKTKSATLSHLFNQGVVSAERFMGDSTFRDGVREKLEKGHFPKFAKRIPKDRPIGANFEVVYAIVTKATAKWPQSLPFFSILSLSNAADRLARMSYRVTLGRIDV
jgi:uncharacterized protein (TIGR04141 family)